MFALVVTSQAIADDNIVIVLDGSGSMNADFGSKNRMETAKEIIKKTVLELPHEGTKVALLCFPRYEWVYPLGPINDAEFTKAVDILHPDGGTPLGANMKVGADELLQARKKDPYGSFRLILMTDGDAQDSGLVDKYCDDILSRGIAVTTIGIGMDNGHQLQKKTPYRSANDAQSLAQATREFVAAEAGAGSNVSVEEVLAEIAPLPDDSANLMIGSISKIQNHPIGTAAPVTVEEEQAQTYSKATVFNVASGKQPSSGMTLVLYGLLGMFCGVLLVFGIVWWIGNR